MDLTETRSRIQDVLFDTNRGFPYIRSRQIRSFLDRIETKFNILINDPHWDTVKLFVSKYPDLSINKDVFLAFLDDLLQLEFVKYVYDKSDTRTFEVPSSLGSPLAIGRKSDNLFTDYEFDKISKHIDDNIMKLSKKSQQGKVPKILQSPPPLSTRRSRRQIKEIKIAELIKSGIRHWNKSLPLINMILLMILILLLSSQLISLEHHIYPYVINFLLYETTDDIYWWQRWSYMEKFVWRLLEYIQRDNI